MSLKSTPITWPPSAWDLISKFLPAGAANRLGDRLGPSPRRELNKPIGQPASATRGVGSSRRRPQRLDSFPRKLSWPPELAFQFPVPIRPVNCGANQAPAVSLLSIPPDGRRPGFSLSGVPPGGGLSAGAFWRGRRLSGPGGVRKEKAEKNMQGLIRAVKDSKRL